MKQAQAIALLPDIKTKYDATLTAAHHLLGKASVTAGLSRVYQPLDDEGETLPSEGTRVQVSTGKVIEDVAVALAELLTGVGIVEATNASPAARADVVVDGVVLVPNAPISWILSAQKSIINLKTFVSKLPVLDPASTWTWNSELECYQSEEAQTTRTKKTPKVIVKSEATQFHPAQTELIYTDEIAGTWTAKKFSGAVTLARQRQLMGRLEALSAALRVAKEDANSVNTAAFDGKPVSDYLFS